MIRHCSDTHWHFHGPNDMSRIWAETMLSSMLYISYLLFLHNTPVGWTRSLDPLTDEKAEARRSPWPWSSHHNALHLLWSDMTVEKQEGANTALQDQRKKAASSQFGSALRYSQKRVAGLEKAAHARGWASRKDSVCLGGYAAENTSIRVHFWPQGLAPLPTSSPKDLGMVGKSHKLANLPAEGSLVRDKKPEHFAQPCGLRKATLREGSLASDSAGSHRPREEVPWGQDCGSLVATPRR